MKQHRRSRRRDRAIEEGFIKSSLTWRRVDSR